MPVSVTLVVTSHSYRTHDPMHLQARHGASTQIRARSFYAPPRPGKLGSPKSRRVDSCVAPMNPSAPLNSGNDPLTTEDIARIVKKTPEEVWLYRACARLRGPHGARCMLGRPCVHACNLTGPLAPQLSRIKLSVKSMKAAYQGVPGAYSEVAAHEACPDCEPLPCEQFETAFQVGCRR